MLLANGLSNYVLLVLPHNNRGIPFARELLLRFMVQLQEKAELSHFFMVDDDLKNPVCASVKDGPVTKTSTPHRGSMKWVGCSWDNLLEKMESLSRREQAILLAPTSTNDKQRMLATQVGYFDLEVRPCSTLQQLVLVNLNKAKELHYLCLEVLNQSEEEWNLCIFNRDEEEIQTKFFQSEDYFICSQVDKKFCLSMLRYSMDPIILESQAKTKKQDMRSPKKVLTPLKSPLPASKFAKLRGKELPVIHRYDDETIVNPSSGHIPSHSPTTVGTGLPLANAQLPAPEPYMFSQGIKLLNTPNTRILSLIEQSKQLTYNNVVIMIFSDKEVVEHLQSALFDSGFQNPNCAGQMRKIEMSENSNEFILKLTFREYDAIVGDGAFESLVNSEKDELRPNAIVSVADSRFPDQLDEPSIEETSEVAPTTASYLEPKPEPFSCSYPPSQASGVSSSDTVQEKPLNPLSMPVTNATSSVTADELTERMAGLNLAPPPDSAIAQPALVHDGDNALDALPGKFNSVFF